MKVLGAEPPPFAEEISSVCVALIFSRVDPILLSLACLVTTSSYLLVDSLTNVLFRYETRTSLVLVAERKEDKGKVDTYVRMPATLFPPLSSEDGSALPSYLKSKFDRIKQIRDLQAKNKENATSTQGAKKDETVHVDPESTSSASATNLNAGAASDNIALEEQKIRLAAETAVACENEISRLARGVAELEELVAQQERGEAMSFRIPTFPSIVPDEDDIDG